MNSDRQPLFILAELVSLLNDILLLISVKYPIILIGFS